MSCVKKSSGSPSVLLIIRRRFRAHVHKKLWWEVELRILLQATNNLWYFTVWSTLVELWIQKGENTPCIASHSSCFPLYPCVSVLDSIFKLGKNLKQIVGKIYGLPNLFNLSILDYLKHKWKEDLNEQIPDIVWQKVIRRIHMSSICQRHTVEQFKIVHRLHWSKVRLSKIRPELNPTCDRCKQAHATLLHTFWTKTTALLAVNF